MAPDHEPDNDHHLAAGPPSEKHPDHESLPSLSDNESDTAASHHTREHGRDDKSRHRPGHAAEEQRHDHDPDPEGPEGLNTDILTPHISAAAAVACAPSQSRASSARSSRPLVVVPRGERRGLFARFVLIPEVERPYDYSRRTKWLITLIVALAAAGGPIGSNIMYPALTDIASDLHTSKTIVNLTVAFYMLSMSIFPLWWSSFSEKLGRRTIYIISFSLFVVFSVLSAVSTNIGMLIAMRILGGGASASVQAVGAGTIADVWDVFERGRAMNTFYLGPLLGPLLAPIIGGALAQGLGWRSTMWFLVIFGGLNLVSLFLFLPETLAKRKPLLPPTPPPGNDTNNSPPDAPSRLARKSRRAALVLRKALLDPLTCLAFLRFPPVALVVAFASVTFAALFVLSVSLQATFSAPPYGFPTIVVGLLYIPGSMGYFLSSLFGGRWVDYIMRREALAAGRYDAKGALVFLPEDRLRENAWIAASMYPLAMIWYGWCADRGVFWFACIVPNFFFGVAAMLVFGAVTTMLTEFVPKRSSSAVALNNFVRNIFSCVGVVVTQPLIDVMGVGWLCTMVAILCLISGNMCTFLLRRYSEKWRKEMDVQMRSEK